MNDAKTEFDRIQEDPVERGNLAAADLAFMVGGLIEAVEAESNLQGREIADAMGVTPGRVTQLLHGDGNLRISTLARLLDACGYSLQITAVPKDPSRRSFSFPRGPRGRKKGSGAKSDGTPRRVRRSFQRS